MANEERQYFVLSDDNCRFESMTKEQILAAILEATGHLPEDYDDGFITKIREMNSEGNLKFWVGSQAEYNALETKEIGTLYIITDDTDIDDWEAAVEEFRQELASAMETINQIINGQTKVGSATVADIVKTYPVQSPFEITEAGLYSVTVSEGSGALSLRYSAMISIDRLGYAVSVQDVGKKNNLPACNILYNLGGAGRITVLSLVAGSEFTIESCRKIASYQ